ncbi:MAG: hypothetical protein RLZ14_1348 [Actinomycetota bacterium]
MNDVDHLLHHAFDSVSAPRDIRPQLSDVRARARRMHRRRTSGMMGAFAVVGAAGVGLQSLRHDARTALTPGDGLGDGVSGSTLPLSDCYQIDTTSMPTVPTVFAHPVVTYGYEIKVGDTPSFVAEKFAITLQELRQANAGNTALDTFVVGDIIAVPFAQSPTTPYPTTALESTAVIDTTIPCESTAPTVSTVWGVSPDTTAQTFENQVTTTYPGQEAPPATGCAYDETPVYCGPPTTSTTTASQGDSTTTTTMG